MELWTMVPLSTDKIQSVGSEGGIPKVILITATVSEIWYNCDRSSMTFIHTHVKAHMRNPPKHNISIFCYVARKV